jgi:alpha-ketoglutarate-dependent taurine dioxygenase
LQEHYRRSLLPFATGPAFAVKWQWRRGDTVVWDNRCTVHAATGFEHETHWREMWRTTLTADVDDV